ncbi:site-specific integrase [Burkholderia reimsis]|uniref:Site-specific integrase n=1 Tax=Burkholderia reimsis TaxID=2234132 RepID=A0A365QUY7_9BURK|nr:site-specific integrase [Burkholderia reimsis]RBB38868.1 site-specific integrase [Burkholderia reimsis]
MATFTTRGSSTRAQVRMRGQEASATFDTRIEAEQWAEQIEARIKRGEVIRHDDFGENPTVAAVIYRFIRDVSPSRPGYKVELNLGLRLAKLETFQKRVANFGAADLRAYRDYRLKGEKPVQSSTFIREMAFLSGVFTHAIREWEVPLKQNPVSMITMPPKGKPRTRRVTEDDIERLAATLNWDMKSTPKKTRQWVMWAFLFAIETAMRRGEFTKVCWRDVHIAERYIYLQTTKNGDSREVPLSQRALALLKLVPVGEPDEKLVPMSEDRFTTLFCEAKKQAGIIDLHAHDSRREAATRVAKKLKKIVGDNDVALLKLSAFTGHKSLQMLKIYFNLSGTEMADALDALDQ